MSPWARFVHMSMDGMAREPQAVLNVGMPRIAYPSPQLWRRMTRAVRSYLVASIVAAAVIAFVGSFFAALPDARHLGHIFAAAISSVSLTAFILLVVVPLAALPTIASVFVMRIARLPRGWADTGFGAATGLTIAVLALAGSPYAEWYGLIALIALAGAVGGNVYWRASDRPQPPYRGWL